MSSLYQSKWATPPPNQARTTATQEPEQDQLASPETAPLSASIEAIAGPSTLSAVAPAFSPSPAPPVAADTFTHDEFAQTGAAQDDLFNNVVPSEESMQTRLPDDLFGDDFIPAAEPIVEQAAPAPSPSSVTPRTIRAEPSRGRGRGRGRGGQTPRNEAQAHTNGNKSHVNGDAEGIKQAQAPDNAPTGPRKDIPASVRGDRQATGGVRKPKLSETELAEKMAQIQLKNVSLTAAHARAEADAASFAQREHKAKTEASQRDLVSKARAREERKDRQQMMGEREKNRIRKLKAMEGREWDAEKVEDDFSKGGKHDKKGSFAGDKTDYTDGREYLLRDAKGSTASGGGRRGENSGRHSQLQNVPPRKEDFPALPARDSSHQNDDSQKALTNDSIGKQVDSGNSWADEVESSATT